MLNSVCSARNNYVCISTKSNKNLKTISIYFLLCDQVLRLVYEKMPLRIT